MSCPSSIKSDDFVLREGEDTIIADILTSDPHLWEFSGSDDSTTSHHSISSGLWSLLSEPELVHDILADTTGDMSAAVNYSHRGPSGAFSCVPIEEVTSGFYGDLYEGDTMDSCLSQPLMDPWMNPNKAQPLRSMTDNNECIVESAINSPSPPKRCWNGIMEADEDDRACSLLPRLPYSNHSLPNYFSEGTLRLDQDLDPNGSPLHTIHKCQPPSDHITSIMSDQHECTFGCQPSRQENEDDKHPDSLYTSTRPRPRMWVMERIESTVADILEALTQGKMPQLEIDSRGSGKAMTEFDPCQGIIRRRRSFAATTVDHDRKWDSAGCFGPLRAIHQAGATDHDSVDEDEDLFELYDEDDNTFTPSCTLSPPVVGTLNAEAGSNILRQTKALSTPSQAKGTKILRMTQSGIKQLTSVIRVMDIVHESVQQDVYITKRDVYYRDVATFRRQEVVDRAIDDIASTFKVPRSSLHVVAGSRGLVYGAIRLTTRRHSVLSTTRGKHNKSNVDCKENDPRMISDETSLDGSSWIESSQAHPIPALEELARIEIRSETRFVLVIEKEATMKYLISTNFCRQHGPCILLTGKGHPDRATRQLLNCLSRMVNLGVTVWYPNGVDEELYTDPCCDIRPMAVGTAQNMQARRQPPRQDSRTSPCEPTDTAPQLSTASLIHSCPLLAVVDCDPYGFWIYFTYKHGSPQMAFDNLNLAAPQLRCLGQVPEDWFTCMDAHSADDLSVSEAAIRSTPTRKEFTSDAMAKLSTAARGDGPRTCQSWRRHPLPSILTSTSTLTSHLSQPRPFHPWDRHLLPLTPNDRARLLKLLTMPFVTASIGWRKQLSKMLMMNRKSELQSLYDPSYSTPSLPSASPSSAKEVAISSTPFAHYLVHKLMNERTWL